MAQIIGRAVIKLPTGLLLPGRTYISAGLAGSEITELKGHFNREQRELYTLFLAYAIQSLIAHGLEKQSKKEWEDWLKRADETHAKIFDKVEKLTDWLIQVIEAKRLVISPVDEDTLKDGVNKLRDLTKETFQNTLVSIAEISTDIYDVTKLADVTTKLINLHNTILEILKTTFDRYSLLIDTMIEIIYKVKPVK